VLFFGFSFGYGFWKRLCVQIFSNYIPMPAACDRGCVFAFLSFGVCSSLRVGVVTRSCNFDTHQQCIVELTNCLECS